MIKKQFRNILFLLSIAAAVAQAGVIFTLAPPVEGGLPGAVLTFSGTVVNNTGADLYLLGLNFTLPSFGPGDIDSTPFFDNTPFPMSDGASVGIPTTVAFFTVTVPTSAPAGEYVGIVDLQGLNSDGLEVKLASLGFEVDVRQGGGGAVPEPGAMPLVAVALGAVAVIGRRIRRS